MLRQFCFREEKQYIDRIIRAYSLSLQILELGIITSNLKEEFFLPNTRKFTFAKSTLTELITHSCIVRSDISTHIYTFMLKKYLCIFIVKI